MTLRPLRRCCSRRILFGPDLALVELLLVAIAFQAVRAEVSEQELLPTDRFTKPSLDGRQPHAQYVPHLAGPWGLPVATDAPSIFSKSAHHIRSRTKRVVIYYDLQWPSYAYRLARRALDQVGAEHHVMAVGLGFPTENKLRDLRLPVPACAAQWKQDHDWLSNQPLPASLKQKCPALGPLPTPCELLLGLVERFRPPAFPNVEHVAVTGFSAGAQVLDRCMYSIRRTYDPYLLGQSLAALTAAHHGEQWHCHHWSGSDHHLLYPHGDLILRQRQVCERVRGDGFEYKFSNGNGHLAPGCGECQCCRRRSRDDDGDHDDRSLKKVSFIIVSPSTLFYPVPERAALPEHSELTCLHFDPAVVLKRSPYNFLIPPSASKSCPNYNDYRYGAEGHLPPDMTIKGNITEATQRRALLAHHVLYIAGSADVCNWQLQKSFSPQCGQCKKHRNSISHSWMKADAVDMASPVVSTCGAMKQGTTRLERIRVYKDMIQGVLAPRLAVSVEQLHRHRKFMTLVGVGHDDFDVAHKLSRCWAYGHCSSHPLASMDDFQDQGQLLIWTAADEVRDLSSGRLRTERLKYSGAEAGSGSGGMFGLSGVVIAGVIASVLLAVPLYWLARKEKNLRSGSRQLETELVSEEEYST